MTFGLTPSHRGRGPFGFSGRQRAGRDVGMGMVWWRGYDGNWHRSFHVLSSAHGNAPVHIGVDYRLQCDSTLPAEATPPPIGERPHETCVLRG